MPHKASSQSLWIIALTLTTHVQRNPTLFIGNKPWPLDVSMRLGTLCPPRLDVPVAGLSKTCTFQLSAMPWRCTDILISQPSHGTEEAATASISNIAAGDCIPVGTAYRPTLPMGTFIATLCPYTTNAVNICTSALHDFPSTG